MFNYIQLLIHIPIFRFNVPLLCQDSVYPCSLRPSDLGIYSPSPLSVTEALSQQLQTLWKFI